jgi:putative serine protease PepD
VFLGVSVQDSTSPQGAQVVSVVPGSPADAAGIKAGDVITAADGTVTSASQLATRVQAHNSGDQISVTYNRSGSSTTVQVKLGSRSASSAPVA